MVELNLVALDARRRANAILRRLPPTPASVIAERRMVLLDAAYPVQHRQSARQRRARVMREMEA